MGIRNPLTKWGVVGVVGVLLISTGFAVMSVSPPEFLFAQICFVLAAAILLAKLVHWLDCYKALGRTRIVLAVALPLLIAGLTAWAVFWVSGRRQLQVESIGVKNNLEAEASASRLPRPIEVLLDCKLQQFPIVIPPHDTAYMLGLNEAAQLREEASLLGIANPEEFAIQWPDAFRMKRVKEIFYASIFIARCDVSNRGSMNLSEVNIPLKTTYGMEENSREYPNTVVTGPLSRGQTFTFYVVNNCEADTSTAVPKSGIAMVVGENSSREFDFQSMSPHTTGGFGIGSSKENWTQTTCK